MRHPPPPTRLLPQQTRSIHAGAAGVRLHVISGRLWLTQPNAAQDLFMGPGEMVDLKQDWVVVQADSSPHSRGACPTDYRLTPLNVPVAARWPAELLQWFKAKKSRIANKVASGVSLIW